MYRKVIILFSLCALSLTLASYAKAQENTIQPSDHLAYYIYKDCKKALQSTSLEEYSKTYCGAFFSAYALGFFRSNWIVSVEPDKNAPCRDDIKLHDAKINNRFSNEESFSRIGTQIKNHALSFVIPYMIWAESYQDQLIKTEVDFTGFSNFLYAPHLPDEELIKIEQSYLNTPLARLEINYNRNEYWPNNFTGLIATTREQAYLKCKTDMDNFSGSWCEAQILGYLSALHSTTPFITKQLTNFERQDKITKCDQVIIDKYTELDIPRKQCVNKHTSPRDIASLFLKKYEHDISRSSYEDDILDKEYNMAVERYKEQNGLGTVAYFAIDDGRLCKDSATSP